MFFPGFSRVLLDLTRFFWPLLGFTGFPVFAGVYCFFRVFTGFSRVLPSFTLRVSLGLIGFLLCLLGFAVFFILLGFPGSYRV